MGADPVWFTYEQALLKESGDTGKPRAVREVGTHPNPQPGVYRTVSFTLGADTRRVLASALGRSRKRVWRHAKSRLHPAEHRGVRMGRQIP